MISISPHAQIADPDPANDDQFSLSKDRDALLGRLDCSIAAVIERLRHSDAWRLLAERCADPMLAATFRDDIRSLVSRCRPNVAAAARECDTRPVDAVRAVWRELGRRGSDHAYLGALYAFEAISTLLLALPDPEVRDDADELRRRSTLPTLRTVLREAMDDDPTAADEVERGIRSLEDVYPPAVLTAAA